MNTNEIFKIIYLVNDEKNMKNELKKELIESLSRAAMNNKETFIEESIKRARKALNDQFIEEHC
jgi:glycerol-3-phosphate cytidylyltransferase-like family protein